TRQELGDPVFAPDVAVFLVARLGPAGLVGVDDLEPALSSAPAAPPTCPRFQTFVGFPTGRGAYVSWKCQMIAAGLPFQAAFVASIARAWSASAPPIGAGAGRAAARPRGSRLRWIWSSWSLDVSETGGHPLRRLQLARP